RTTPALWPFAEPIGLSARWARVAKVGQPIAAAAGFQPAPGVSTFPEIFHASTHYMWGRRFRLPTRYVLPQKASTLASRSHGGKLPVCYLAFGWLHPTGTDPAAAHIVHNELAGEGACPTISAGRAFLVLDREVDQAAFGPVWLQDARVASVVADALLYGENGRHF